MKEKEKEKEDGEYVDDDAHDGNNVGSCLSKW